MQTHGSSFHIFHKVCMLLLFPSPSPPLLSFESKLFNQDANCPSYRGAPFLFLIAHLLQRKRRRAARKDKRFFSEKISSFSGASSNTFTAPS